MAELLYFLVFVGSCLAVTLLARAYGGKTTDLVRVWIRRFLKEEQ